MVFMFLFVRDFLGRLNLFIGEVVIFWFLLEIFQRDEKREERGYNQPTSQPSLSFILVKIYRKPKIFLVPCFSAKMQDIHYSVQRSRGWKGANLLATATFAVLTVIYPTVGLFLFFFCLLLRPNGGILPKSHLNISSQSNKYISSQSNKFSALFAVKGWASSSMQVRPGTYRLANSGCSVQTVNGAAGSPSSSSGRQEEGRVAKLLSWFPTIID